MIFVSDYDGDPDEYLAAFGIGIERGMRWSFGSYAGFPGPRPTPLFVDYVTGGRSEVLLRYSAYPDATVRDVDSALAVAEKVDRLREVVEGYAHDDAGTAVETRMGVAYRDLLRALTIAPEHQVPSRLSGVLKAVRHKSTVSGLALCLPIEPERRAEAEAALHVLATKTRAALGEIGGLHFARATVVEAPQRRRPWWSPWRFLAGTDVREECPPHLLFCAWVDGPVEPFVARLAKALATPDDGRTPSDDLWGYCAGYPGADDSDRQAEWLLAHQLRFSLFLDSRAGISAEQIQAALRLRDKVGQTVAAHEGSPLRETCRALAQLEGDLKDW
jgi:hypothetical protein